MLSIEKLKSRCTSYQHGGEMSVAGQRVRISDFEGHAVPAETAHVHCCNTGEAPGSTGSNNSSQLAGFGLWLWFPDLF